MNIDRKGLMWKKQCASGSNFPKDENVRQLKLTFLQTNCDLLHNSGGGCCDMDIRKSVPHRLQEEKTSLSSLATVRLFGAVAIHVQLHLRSCHFVAVLLSKRC